MRRMIDLAIAIDNRTLPDPPFWLVFACVDRRVELRLVLQPPIGDRQSHGYTLIRAIEDRIAGATSPSPGVIYPTRTLPDGLNDEIVTPGEG